MAKQGSAFPFPRTAADPPAIAALEQFLRNLHGLQELFRLPAVCERELVLRSEMRKTMSDLAAALAEAAEGERITKLAALYREAAGRAADLAANGPCRQLGH